jgi:hypothetical protein
MVLLAAGVLWLMRVPSDAKYLTDLLPAFTLVGIAIGLTGPSVQVGALSGVAGSAAGLASGLVETMRQIGGVVGIATVTTVLVTRTNSALQSASPAARQAAALEGFQSAFTLIAAVAILGALVAAIGFPRTARAMRAPAVEASEPVGKPALAARSADGVQARANGTVSQGDA